MSVGGQDKNCALVLHDVYTEEIIFERKDSYNKRKSELEYNIGYSYNEGYNGRFKIIIKVEINDKKNDSLKIDTSVSGIFEIKGDNDCEKILIKNAIAILFPYVRSNLTNITSQSGIEPLILPVINFNALLDKGKM